MGYNLSDNAYQQVKSILDELIDLQIGNIWKQSFQDNYKAARLIRQGFEYCTQNPDKVGKRYAELKKNIRIRVTNDYVLAERKFSALAPIERVESIREKVFEGMNTFNEVVTTVLANKHLSSMHFPDFKNEELVDDINKVCSRFGFEITFMDSEKSLTPKDIGLWVDKNAEPRNTEEHSN
jgi:hypothetical protein